MASNFKLDDFSLWHQRLGHFGNGNVKLFEQKLVEGIANNTKNHFQQIESAQEVLGLVHLDI